MRPHPFITNIRAQGKSTRIMNKDVNLTISRYEKILKFHDIRATEAMQTNRIKPTDTNVGTRINHSKHPANTE